MVKTLEYAAEKWERKTAAKGAKWKDRTIAGEGNYCANFGAFVGHPVTMCATPLTVVSTQ